MRYSFTVPGKPVPWQRTGFNPRIRSKGRRFFTPAATLRYQELVRFCARRAGVRPLAGPVSLELRIFFPDRRVRDDDNVEKSIRDALQERRARWKGPGPRPKGTPAPVLREAIAWVNDHQVRQARRSVDVDRENPRVEVTIEEIEA